MQYIIFPLCILIGATFSFVLWKIFKSIKISFITSIVIVLFGVFLIIKAKTQPSEGMKDLAYVLNAILLFSITIGMWIHQIIIKIKK